MTPETPAVSVIPSESLRLLRSPAEMLAEAKQAADALKDVIEHTKRKPLFIHGELYLYFEHWQTVGHFFGVTPKVVATKPVRYGEVRGFLARAEALRNGEAVSAAEAICMNDESKWSVRARYGKDEYDRKVKIGDEPVPRFQLRSMAQTRACAKALRLVLSWVVVLAGYSPTPAEEMVGDEFNQSLPSDICRDCGMDLWGNDGLDAQKETGKRLCRVCFKKALEKRAASALDERKRQFSEDATRKQPETINEVWQQRVERVAEGGPR